MDKKIIPTNKMERITKGLRPTSISLLEDLERLEQYEQETEEQRGKETTQRKKKRNNTKKKTTTAQREIKRFEEEVEIEKKLTKEITDFLGGFQSQIKNKNELEYYELERNARRDLIDALRIKFNVKKWQY